jgi:hypothetical protein
MQRIYRHCSWCTHGFGLNFGKYTVLLSPLATNLQARQNNMKTTRRVTEEGQEGGEEPEGEEVEAHGILIEERKTESMHCVMPKSNMGRVEKVLESMPTWF